MLFVRATRGHDGRYIGVIDAPTIAKDSTSDLELLRFATKLSDEATLYKL